MQYKKFFNSNIKQVYKLIQRLFSYVWMVGIFWGINLNTLRADQIWLTASDNLHQKLSQAKPGDQLMLSPGRYTGNLVISQSISLIGQPDVLIDAGGQGHGVLIQAEDVHLQGLIIKNWGDDLSTLDAGIFVERTAANVKIINNYLQGGGFGIWLDGAPSAQVVSNRVQGDQTLRSTDRGNGIHLSNVTDAEIRDNEVWHTRDGIYIESSNHNTLVNNYLHDLRYGIHYMYSYTNEVSFNLTKNTRTGYALMQSKYLTVTHNRSVNDRNYGILLNFVTHSVITNNQVEGVQGGLGSTFANTGSTVLGSEGKAIFIYNSLFNRIVDNLFMASELGIHLTAGSEENILFKNAFIANREQVKYVASRPQEWSYQGQGNYWSDYLGWDMDGDGIGDVQYEPNDSIDKLLWKYPTARILMHSPAVEILRWVQHHFPIFKSEGVSDSSPLMQPPYAVNKKTVMTDN